MEFDLIEKGKFLIVQIIHALPSSWNEFCDIAMKILTILLSRIIIR